MDDSYEKIIDLTKNRKWDLKVLREIFTNEVIKHIVQNVKPSNQERDRDKPYWMLNIKRVSKVKSVWWYVRHKEDSNKV